MKSREEVIVEVLQAPSRGHIIKIVKQLCDDATNDIVAAYQQGVKDGAEIKKEKK